MGSNPTLSAIPPRNKDGTPAAVAEGATTLTYEYDAAGRPSAFKNGTTQLTAWTYTAGTSTIATRTDGTANTTSFGYDWARRATSISATAGAFAGTGTVSRTYRLDGTLATQVFPSSITETLACSPACPCASADARDAQGSRDFGRP